MGSTFRVRRAPPVERPRREHLADQRPGQHHRYEARDVEVLGLTYFQLASEFIGQIRDSDVEGTGHGGEFEISLMLYLREELVRTSKLESTEMVELTSRDSTTCS